MLKVTLLGTGGTQPLPDRALAAAAVTVAGRSVLLDCGEGTQVGLRRYGVSAYRLSAVLLTHYHGDHILGLPGLLQTLGSLNRTEPLTVYGPAGLDAVARPVMALAGAQPYPVLWREADAPFSVDALKITPFPLAHRVPCCGYALELPRAGRFDPARARAAGIPVAYWKTLQKGAAAGGFTPEQVLGPPRRGLKVVYATDTRPCAALEAAARQFTVCPFELGLDLSAWADVVIGDYNYLFDPVVRLHRFFDAAGDWLFLIDEAHNLPDRARAMYSAGFAKSALTEAKRALGRGKSSLKTALSRADRAFLEARKQVAVLAPRRGVSPPTADAAGQTSLLEETPAPGIALPEPLLAQEGTVFFRELPDALLKPLHALQAPLQDWLEQNPDADAHARLLELYFAVQDITRAADRYDTHFVTQLTARGSELELELLCLDPSAFVDASLGCGRAAALFSATLTPPGYYRGVLGCPDARAVALESPFPPDHLGLYCLPGISTRYRDREASIPAVSDALAALAGGKVGNYLAFFPSYAYLRRVYEDFTARYPGIATLAQESGLDDAARAAFLQKFTPDPAQTLLGFGVMGGIFGEGVDLVGDRLIGCAIVGVGLPQVNPQQEILRRYYDEQSGTGFDYAYRYPGMNKVLQAAGRVIRTAGDRGVVLLLDDRFARSEYTRLFPRHWQHLKYLNGTEALKEELDRFWGQGSSR